MLKTLQLLNALAAAKLWGVKQLTANLPFLAEQLLCRAQLPWALTLRSCLLSLLRPDECGMRCLANGSVNHVYDLGH